MEIHAVQLLLKVSAQRGSEKLFAEILVAGKVQFRFGFGSI